MGVFVYPGKCL